MVNVAGLDTTLYVAANDQASEGDLCVMAIALAGPARFMDVEKAVRDQARITTDMVDWAQGPERRNAVLRPS